MVDIGKLREDMEREFDWSYVEEEGPDTIRFDRGQNSLWVMSSGETYGFTPTSKMKKVMSMATVLKSDDKVIN